MNFPSYSKTRILYALILTLSYVIPANAVTEFTYEQLTTATGLANNTVRFIMQDSRGDMWFATSSGVSRYRDGRFTNFHPIRHSNTPGLKDQRVRLIYEDRNDHIWFSTAKGISCYDLGAEEFTDYIKKGIKEPVFPEIKIRELKDARGRTWKVTDNDGLIITYDNGRTEHFTTASQSVSLPTNSLKCIFMDRSGTIWIGTDNLGVSKLTVMQSDGIEYMLEGENIRMLTRLGKDRIAIGNRKGDVWIYDSALKSVVSQNHYDFNTYCMYEDTRHNIWRGTKGGGLYLNEKKVEGLPHEEIYSIDETNDSSILIGTFGAGLVRYDTRKSAITDILLNDRYGSDRIRKLVFSSGKQTLWATTSEGAYELQTSPKMKVTRHLSTSDESLYSDEVRTAFMDSKGRLYLSEAGSGFTMVTHDSLFHFQMSDSLVNDMVQSIVEDRKGFIWIATEFGISCLNPATHRLTSYFFSKDMLKNVYGENCGILLDDGRVAFGSNHGIVIIHPSRYTDGLENTDINAGDLTLNGSSAKSSVRFIYQQWWRSPWTWLIISAILTISAIIAIRMHRKHQKLGDTISQLSEVNDELTAEKDELAAERNELTAEKNELAAEKEKLERDIHIRREAIEEASGKEFVDMMEHIAGNHLSDADFTADDFAREMGLGRTAFFRKMKELTGYSPKEYMKLIRVRCAADLISTTSDTISEIAMKVGINDPLYFSRVFKSEYNCSPKEWRNNFRKQETRT